MNVSCFFTENNGEINCNETIYSSECNRTMDSGGEGEVKPTEPLFWVYLLVYIFFVLFAGMEL